MNRDDETLLDLERFFDDRNEMQERAKKNYDLYHRDVRYALDLFDDVLAKRLTAVEARNVLRTVYAGGKQELKRWEWE